MEAWDALRGHPRATDAAVAILLAAFVLWEIFTTDVDGELAVVVPAALLMTLPLAWRRTAPLPVTAIVMFALAAESVLVNPSQETQTPIIALLLAMYSVGAHAERRQAIAGLALGAAAILVDEAGDFIVMGPVFALAWSAGRLVRAREADARKLRELAEALDRERVEEARLAVGEERARIARDLHDVVAHAMSSIVLEAGAERVNLEDGHSSTSEALRSIERTGREAMVEMRRLVGVLRSEDEGPALVPQPGLAHLDALAEHVRRAGVPVDTRVVGEPVELAPGLDISAYRIVQEALTNVMKHAGQAHASVVVTYRERVIDIDISDDGSGGVAERRRPRAHGPARAGGPLRWRTPGGQWRGGRLRGARPPAHRGRPAMSLRVLIADDQAVVRSGLRRILEVDPEIEVVGEAVDGLAAVEAARRLSPDLVLMDVRMPRLDGIAATGRILTEGADPPRVLILTTFGLDDYVTDALRAGASGFLLKDASPEDLLAGVRAVAQGDALLDPAVTAAVIARFSALPTPRQDLREKVEELTAREREVLMLLGRGRSNSEIAGELVVSEGTVKTHVGRVLMKLGLRDRIQAVIFGYESGLIQSGDDAAGGVNLVPP